MTDRAQGKRAGRKRCQGIYLPSDMLIEIEQQAARLDRTIGWVMRKAWQLARAEIERLPTMPKAGDGE